MLPAGVTHCIVATVDANLVALAAVEQLISLFKGELVEEWYDERLLPIAAKEATYGVYQSHIMPQIAFILRRSQIRYGHRKAYFKSLPKGPVYIGIGSLPTYLKTEALLNEGKNTSVLQRWDIESFTLYCEAGNLEQNAKELCVGSVKYIHEKVPLAHERLQELVK